MEKVAKHAAGEDRKGVERYEAAILSPRTSEYSSHSSVVFIQFRILCTVPYSQRLSVFYEGFCHLGPQFRPVSCVNTSLCLHTAQKEEGNCDVLYRRRREQERPLSVAILRKPFWWPSRRLGDNNRPETIQRSAQLSREDA